MKKRFSSPETLMAHFGEDRGEDRGAHHGAVIPPLYQNSLFTFRDWDDIDAAFENRTERPIYSRLSNPTTTVAEKKVAALAGEGAACRLFSSGMAAISAAIFHAVSAGDHVVAVKNVYGPTNNFLNTYLSDKLGLTTTFVAGNHLSDFEQAVTNKTRLIILESPSSAIFSLQDIPAIVAFAKSKGILTMIDNTWATPLFQQAWAMGVDLEVHSVSKYLGGHSDIVAGAIISTPERIKDITVKEGEWFGGAIAPFTSWLLTRSLRTLPMRLERHQQNALKVASFLEAHPSVRQVRYPGLKSHPQYDLGQKLMTGYTGLMSFVLNTDDLTLIKRFFNSLDVFQIGVSWGGHESLIYAPAISYLKELPPEQFKDLGISLGDMRISVGLESSQDQIDDLAAALDQVV